MSYQPIADKLSAGQVVILDGAIGTELERRGVQMDGALWCGRATVEQPDIVRAVHDAYLEAGADVITANTYATPTTAMHEAGLSAEIAPWNQQAIKIAKDAAAASGRDVAVAGSVSTYGSWQRLGIDVLAPGFALQARICADAGADLLILETLASEPEIVDAAIEMTADVGLPVWLAISALADDDGALHQGARESREQDLDFKAFAPLDQAISRFSQKFDGPILIMHSELTVTADAVATAKAHHDGVIGAYPNAGFWKRPSWAFVDQVEPEAYAAEAEGWRDRGAQIIGGCCGVGPSHIAATASRLSQNGGA
ncbi:MAG: homocysteine S-methyltransferase family protein [Pseudomonadota bacterium]